MLCDTLSSARKPPHDAAIAALWRPSHTRTCDRVCQAVEEENYTLAGQLGEDIDTLKAELATVDFVTQSLQQQAELEEIQDVG